MKPAPFAYCRAESLQQVFDLLDQHGDAARIMAGGQSLMATLNMRLSAPDLLIDINHLDGLSGISVADGWVRIGALTRHVDIEHAPTIAAHLPLLAQAMPHIAHPAIRNRGTLGGSIAFADPAAELPACAVALGARMVIEGPGGARTVAADDFFEGMFETALAANEVLIAVEFPAAGADDRSGFAELVRRHGDYAMVGLAARGARVEAGVLRDLRLVYFAVGDRPLVATGAMRALEGKLVDDAALAAARAALADDLDPPADLHGSGDFKRHLAGVVLGRVLANMSAGA